jgi:hypothetical protein
VPSVALTTWRGERSDRLDELVEAHRRVGGTGAGRRTETEQINWALVLRLAAEFQGFARDLHAQAADTFAACASGGDRQLENVIVTLLTRGLKLDIGNAEPGSLGEAFNRFGLRWWPALERRDSHTKARQQQLESLNRARNAIAHSRLVELASLRSEGYALTLRTFRTWRQSLNGLAGTMDLELADHLSRFFGRPKPW